MRSEFATRLDALFASVMSRGDWAAMLGVSPPAISQWVNDKTAPKPEHVLTIYNFCDSTDARKYPEFLEFIDLATRPLADITPLADRFKDAQTLNEYMFKEPLRRLCATFSTMPTNTAARLIRELTEETEATKDACDLLDAIHSAFSD